jgi:hypothetical protein
MGAGIFCYLCLRIATSRAAKKQKQASMKAERLKLVRNLQRLKEKKERKISRIKNQKGLDKL